MNKFHYWILIAVNVVTTLLIGCSAWWNWQAYQHRLAQMQELQVMQVRVAAVEEQLRGHTKVILPQVEGQ